MLIGINQCLISSLAVWISFSGLFILSFGFEWVLTPQAEHGWSTAWDSEDPEKGISDGAGGAMENQVLELTSGLSWRSQL